jgi:hypothetical protein
MLQASLPDPRQQATLNDRIKRRKRESIVAVCTASGTATFGESALDTGSAVARNLNKSVVATRMGRWLMRLILGAMSVSASLVWAQQPKVTLAPALRGDVTDWREINPGDKVMPVMSIDLNSLAQLGSTLRIRSLLDLPEPSIDAMGRRFASALQQLHITCDSGHVAIETVGYYTANRGRGVFMDNPDRRQVLAFSAPRPGTPTATVASLICEISISNSSHAPRGGVPPVTAAVPFEAGTSTGGASSTWQLVNPGDSQWPAYYIETFSIGTDGPYKTVRTLADNKSGVLSRTGKTFKSSLGLLYVDCASGFVGLRAYGIYTGLMGAGTFSEEAEPIERLAFGTPRESTPVAKIASRVCNGSHGR